MKTVPKFAMFLCACTWLTTSAAFGQLRIVTYNAATDTNPAGDTARAGMATVLQAIGIESTNGIQKPLDILSLQETTTSLGGATSIVNILNGIYGAGTYARSTIVGGSTDGTTLAVIYNTKTVQLVGQAQIGTASTTGAARAPLRFEFQPVGYDPSADFYIYDSHYKAGTASSDMSRRTIEAQEIRADADSLGPSARVVFTGDYNIQSSNETMYQTLTAAGGTGRAVDPINSPGNWNTNAGFAAIDTQAPLVTAPNGLTGGGMDDRFDFQLSTAAMQSGQGVSYIGPNVPNLGVTPATQSYHPFGNNGTTFNSDINNPSNTALPASSYAPAAGQPSRTDVLNALTTASDHLPLVADYQLPAKMNVSVAPIPAQVIKGSAPTANVSVLNAAPVSVAIGADELNYQVAGSGAVGGTSSGTVLALAPAGAASLSLDTTAVGAHSGTISASSSSVSVANGTFSQPVSYTVVDHSAPSLDSSANVHQLTVDFGTVAQNSGTHVSSFKLTNLAGNFQAALDLLGTTEVDDAANRFSTDASPFTGLVAGASSQPFAVSFQTDEAGSFSAEYLLNVADAAGVFGGTGQTLEIDAMGTVAAAVPEPSSCVLALLAGAAAVCYRRRKRT